MSDDVALVFEDQIRPAGAPGTHVLIVGVGKYLHGRGAGQSLVGGDLNQLTSPPRSARAMADWFLAEYRHPARPLASLSLVISEENPEPYQPPAPAGAAPVDLPEATLEELKRAASRWAARASRNRENLAVFYFCGHGVSLGQKAALLLSDFGDPAAAYDGAIDLDTLRGTMSNAAAVRQLFLLDCCRTAADDLYVNEKNIGSRILSVVRADRGHNEPPQQCILFPTLDGEVAFGLKDGASVFTSSFLDAVRFAAADDATGNWVTTTSSILGAVDRLVSYRVPHSQRSRSKPTALEATNFEFNEIFELRLARSYVTLSDLSVWSTVQILCQGATGNKPEVTPAARAGEASCDVFELEWGTWRFSGRLPVEPPRIAAVERMLTRPVAYITLGVEQ